MKFKVFNSRGEFSPSLYLGKVMWRCRNGSPKFETEYNISGGCYKHYSSEKVFPIPSLYILRWHKGVSASDKTLGSLVYSASIGIEWWNFQYSIMFLKVIHTKTTEQINDDLKKEGLNLVL